MNRAAWLRVIENWFQKAELQQIPGYTIPKDVPAFVRPVVSEEDGSTELCTITVGLRKVAAKLGDYTYGKLEGTILIADIEVCILVRNVKY